MSTNEDGVFPEPDEREYCECGDEKPCGVNKTSLVRQIQALESHIAQQETSLNQAIELARTQGLSMRKSLAMLDTYRRLLELRGSMSK